jgi:NDP-sugar pyrophosphorylase family protein
MTNAKLALILAAGNGSRLASCSGELPKPLVQLHGKPLLEHVISGAREAGIERFVIVLGYRGTCHSRVV